MKQGQVEVLHPALSWIDYQFINHVWVARLEKFSLFLNCNSFVVLNRVFKLGRYRPSFLNAPKYTRSRCSCSDSGAIKVIGNVIIFDLWFFSKMRIIAKKISMSHWSINAAPWL